MEPRKIAALGGVAAIALTATLVVWDVLVITDEERIEAFADAVTDDIEKDNINTALAYVDPSIQPILIEVRGQSIRYEEETQEQFSAVARARLRPYEGTSQHVMRKHIDMQDERATVATETFSRRGRVAVDWELRKRNDTWLVSRMSVR